MSIVGDTSVTVVGRRPRDRAPEELLPVEKRLILWSLLSGVVLLVALTLLSRALFPN
jgi:hypothetical protein